MDWLVCPHHDHSASGTKADVQLLVSRCSHSVKPSAGHEFRQADVLPDSHGEASTVTVEDLLQILKGVLHVVMDSGLCDM